ncbi:MAG: cryptochrome/photolyase family protein [Patescibacteria group bacterium]
MSAATIIYPHQLFTKHPALSPQRPVYLVEEPLLLTRNPIHRGRLLLHKLSLDAYERRLRDAGHTVNRLSIHDHPSTDDVFARLRADGVTELHVTDTTDHQLERAIADSGLSRIWYDSPLFVLSKAEAMDRYTESHRFLTSFYKRLRQDRGILLTESGEPLGGQWSFDAENRERIPPNQAIPADPTPYGNAETTDAAAWVETVAAEMYGEATIWLPYTHAGARDYLDEFLTERFANFGPYEDAMTERGVRLWHSALSPLLNIGLLTPAEVLRQALAYADAQSVPLNSLEGFVRQLLGWREFLRASYEVDGSQMRTSNHFKHTRTLAPAEWHGETGLGPVDQVISTALHYGYTHHIERLMVMGNYFLLTGTHPDEVYRWFMGLYLDAYDWVMVPNVYGMSQFADGGSFATKPYIAGANYIRKMSDYPRGDWEETFTALYWHFVASHRATFATNHRTSMLPRTWDKLGSETQARHHKLVTTYLQTLANRGV